MDTLRAFIAVELPDQIHKLMAAKQDELRAAMGRASEVVRWARSESTHLTLQFLGDIAEDAVPGIAYAIHQGALGQQPIQLTLSRTSAFPGITRPRVLWMGLEGETGRLVTLQSRVSARLKTLGYEPDKPFQPHITLARVRDNATRADLDAIAWALRQQENKPIEHIPFTANHISLIKSELRPGGSVYTELVGIPLVG